MDEKTRKILAGSLVVAGLMQAIGVFFTQNFSIVSLAMILGGLAIAVAGVLFWFETALLKSSESYMFAV